METFVNSYMPNYFDQSGLNKSRKDKFSLIIPIPQVLRDLDKRLQKGNNVVDMNTLELSIYGTIVPKNVIPAEDVRYAGGNVYVSSHNKPSYDPITVNFTIDNQFQNYWVIHKWLNQLRSEKNGYYEYPEQAKNIGIGQYSSDFIIIARDEFNKEVIKWIYKSAFPISLGEITYNHRDAEEIETSFEFVFRGMETILLD
jgi:hypothetical protein